MNSEIAEVIARERILSIIFLVLKIVTLVFLSTPITEKNIGLQ